MHGTGAVAERYTLVHRQRETDIPIDRKSKRDTCTGPGLGFFKVYPQQQSFFNKATFSPIKGHFLILLILSVSDTPGD